MHVCGIEFFVGPDAQIHWIEIAKGPDQPFSDTSNGAVTSNWMIISTRPKWSKHLDSQSVSQSVQQPCIGLYYIIVAPKKIVLLWHKMDTLLLTTRWFPPSFKL